jgi:hypothetical protein
LLVKHTSAIKHWNKFAGDLHHKFEDDHALINEVANRDAGTLEASIVIGRSNTPEEAAYLIGERHSWEFLEFDYSEMHHELTTMVPYITKLADSSRMSPGSKRTILQSIHQMWEASRHAGKDPSTYTTASFDTMYPNVRNALVGEAVLLAESNPELVTTNGKPAITDLQYHAPCARPRLTRAEREWTPLNR